MTTDRELMQQALYVFDLFYESGFDREDCFAVIKALRERLAQPLVSSDGTSTWVDAPQRPVTPREMKPCAGRNCGSTNPNLHSAECFEDYEKATGMAAQQPGIEELEHENRLMRARNERLQAEVERLEEQSEKRQYDADHVVLEKGTNDCVCTHCGQRYHIHMPVPMGIMTAIVDAFLKTHHHCEKPEAV